MKNFNFNEKQDIDNMIACGYVDENNYRTTIGKLALYNYKVLGMKKEDNYDAIKEYMSINALDFFEAEYQDSIYKEITSAKKKILRDIDNVYITDSELKCISALNDIRKEKIAFVLVATAKYYDTIKEVQCHYTNLSNAEICRMARITMRASERNQFMSFIYNEGVTERHTRSQSNGKKILFVSDDENDEIILRLKQIDFEELAYQYLNWKNNGGFDRCSICGRLIKHRKNVLYCQECAKQKHNDSNRERQKKWYNNHEKPNG